MMLWRGVLPALWRHAIYTGTRMTAYEQIRDSIQVADKTGSVRNDFAHIAT